MNELGLNYLTRAQVKDLIPDWKAQIDLVEQTYVELAAGEVEMPPKPGIHPRRDAFIHAMPAFLKKSDVAAVKWVSGYPGNRSANLPYISGLLVLNDANTGIPRAVMDCVEVTAARTAAASGVCVRRWAPKGWDRVAILGCGEQGNYHADMLLALNPGAHIVAYDPNAERAKRLQGASSVAQTPERAVRDADVVITASPIVKNPAPQVFSEHLADRHLILPVDFDSLVSYDVISDADLFLVDDIAQYEHYVGQGHFTDWNSPVGAVGSFVRSDRQDDRIACCNLGVGALDAAYAQLIDNRARAEGIGTLLPL